LNPNSESEILPEAVERKFWNETTEKQVENALQRLDHRLDLDASARYSGALCRRRVVKSGADLLHFVLVYCLTDWSLRMIGLWGTLMDVGSLSKSAVRKRLRQCQPWIGMLIVRLLMANQLSVPQYAGMKVRLFDASLVSLPGSRKADWRLHLGFDLTHLRIDGVHLTTYKQGETLTQWTFQPNEICLADRCYGNAANLGVLLGALAYFVIRIGWQNLPIYDREGQRLAISDWLRVLSTDPAAAPAERQVWVKTPQGQFPVRLIARAIPPEKAAKARKTLLAQAKQQKHTLDQRSLLAAGFVMVVSNLPPLNWSATQILALYRFRWQVELVFKRLKSILAFDQVRAHDPQLAQVYLLTKILIALVLQEHRWRLALQDPDAFSDAQHPLSLWRLDQLLLEAFRQKICGQITLELIQEHRHELRRYLQDDPRRRRKQLVPFSNLGMLCGF